MSADERYDEAVVDMIAEKVFVWHNNDDLDHIRSILTALADAGLLLPPGGEVTEEWGIQPTLYNSSTAELCFSKEQAVRLAKTRDGKVYRRTVDKLPNGSTVTTAWEEVLGTR